MSGLLRLIAAKGVYALAFGVFIGILFPTLASAARPLMVWTIGGLLVISLVRVDWHSVRQLSRRYVVLASAVLLLLIVSPVFIWALAGFTIPNGVWLAIILMAAAPPITSAPAMIALIGLDADLSLIVLILCSLLAPFTVASIAAIADVELTISSLQLFMRLAVFVGVSTLLAIGLRRALGVSRIEAAAHWLSLISVVLLLVFAIAIMDGVWQLLVDRPEHVLKVTAIGIGANFALLLLGTLTMLWCGLRQALTIGFLAANCNMGTLWAVLPSDTPQDVFLYFAVAQIPMYITPALLRFVWVRLGTR